MLLRYCLSPVAIISDYAFIAIAAGFSAPIISPYFRHASIIAAAFFTLMPRFSLFSSIIYFAIDCR
jgi:hypothetical protein